MGNIEIVEREVAKDELDCMSKGFQEHQISHGNPIQQKIRHTFVMLDEGRFVGCVSGLRDNNWFYLSDLWLEGRYRKLGLGKKLLIMWENRVGADSVKHVYTWTAGYEAPSFYKKQGWSIFVELMEYYPSGHSRVGLLKTLG